MSLEDKAQKKHSKFGHLPLSTSGPQDCALVGSALLNTPYFNKGSAFPPNERKEFELYGLLPQAVMSLNQQVERAYQQYSSRKDDLAKNTFMTSMKEQNEVLYYRVSSQMQKRMDMKDYYPPWRSPHGANNFCHVLGLVTAGKQANEVQLIQDHLKEMFSIIYTPTEGEAIQNFSRLFRRPEGCFLNIEDVDRVRQDLSQWGSAEDIDYIVVTGMLLGHCQF